MIMCKSLQHLKIGEKYNGLYDRGYHCTTIIIIRAQDIVKCFSMKTNVLLCLVPSKLELIFAAYFLAPKKPKFFDSESRDFNDP